MLRLAIAGIFLLLLGATVLPAQDLRIGKCNLAIPGATDKESFLAFDRELRAGLSQEDPMIISLLVGFPLRVNGDGGTIQITTAGSLQSRFQEIFPPEIRSVVLEQPVESIFCNFGGIMYGHGQVWITVTTRGRYQISAINLPRSDSVPRVYPKLDFVCDAEKHRVVIDLNAEGTPRYRSWNKPRLLTEPPDLEIATGTKNYEGTGPCAGPVWKFEAGDAEFTIMTGGCHADSNPPLPEGYRGSLDVRVGSKSQHWVCY